MARNEKDGSTVAAKEVRSEYVNISMSDDETARQLENAQKQMQLNHENITKIFATYDQGGEKWIFMEYFTGGNLHSYARNHFAEFQMNKVNLMKQIANGLKYLHDLDIIHGHVEPNSIFVNWASDTHQTTVKLSGFGFSEFPDQTTGSPFILDDITDDFDYFAPELIMSVVYHDGSSRYDKRVDIFSLGLTFRSILYTQNGRIAFPEADGCQKSERHEIVGEVMIQRNNDGQPNLVVVGDNKDDNLETKVVKTVIRRATSFNPDDRPSATQILQTLWKLEGNQQKAWGRYCCMPVGGVSSNFSNIAKNSVLFHSLYNPMKTPACRTSHEPSNFDLDSP